MSNSLHNSASEPPAEGASASRFARLWADLTHLGLDEPLRRLGTHLAALVLIAVTAWGMGKIPTHKEAPSAQAQAAQAAELPAPAEALSPPSLPELPDGAPVAGLRRQAKLDTTIPSRSRVEVLTYTVQTGDTLFGIAAQFSLKPESILWANYDTLADDPHRLLPGQTLNILPVDGAYYRWHAGDGLNGVAQFYGVTPEDILNWPGNHLDPAAIGDYSDPNIPAGTWLIIPGGRRAFTSWSAPIIPRSDPAVAKVLGPGFCGAVEGGPVGSGSFIWPADHHYLSGYDYAPQANHPAIDIDGETGDPVYAVDSGVVVYAGWNDWGYGNLIVIDHGNGWQSLYAHLSALNVECGSFVFQGDVIGAIGSTGNSTGSHLHFALMHAEYGKVNPWDFLP